MVPNLSLSQHLASDPYGMPGFHKTIRLNRNRSEEEIYEKIINGACLELTLSEKVEDLITDVHRKRWT